MLAKVSTLILDFDKEFSLGANHFSNTHESLKFKKDIMLPYVKKQRSMLNLAENQQALVIMEVFTGRSNVNRRAPKIQRK